MYDVVIIGAGPAGLSAAIYAMRARLNALVLESAGAGGQVLTTYEVDNYPALPGISGLELGQKLKEHAEKLGAEIVNTVVRGVVDKGSKKVVLTSNGDYETKTVIIAGGAKHACLNVPGEEELSGMGVSYCATCDGAFYKDANVAVVGGGDVAVEDAIFLARLCKKVYLIHRRDTLRAAASLQDALRSYDNIEMIWNSEVNEICGVDECEVNGLEIHNKVTDEITHLDVEGIFIAVGIRPNTKVYGNSLQMDEGGYIIAGEDCKTSVPGIFAAGDIRTKALRQIITAAADGANAITSVQEFLISRDGV